MNHRNKNVLLIALFGALLLVTEHVGAVGTRHIALRNGTDFEGGKLQGVAIDSVGRVRAGLNLGSIPLSTVTTVWDVLPMGRGRLLLATGNEGRLLEFSAGKVKTVAETDAIALTAVEKVWGGEVIVAALPGAQLYRLQRGKLVPWVTLPGADNVFDLAYDPTRRALFAATGPNGKLFRVTKDKKVQVFFDGEEEHLMSVATHKDAIYAGGGDRARLYKITAPGRASVLRDFGSTEVRRIRVNARGDVFAIANELKNAAIPRSKSAPTSNSSSSASKGKGVLYRIDRDGTPELLLEDKGEHFVSLELNAQGEPLVGTGYEGRLLTVDKERNSVLLADVDQRQVSAMVLGSGATYLVGSDPAVLHPINGRGGNDAIWTSKVVDAGLRAKFGRLSFTVRGTLEFQTRSGNTKEPDASWSDWSKPMTQASDILSPPGRFLQLRARFAKDPNAVLDEVSVSLVTDNLRAVIQSIRAESSATKSLSPADGKLKPSGGALTDESAATVELSWTVSNPDKDELRYRIEFQRQGSTDWFDALKPHVRWTSKRHTWKTNDLPEGKYRVRITASDEISNPLGTALRHQLVSHWIGVDNTAPRFSPVTVRGTRISGSVSDGVGPIARLEVSVVGTDDWFPVPAVDGIFDERLERFDVDLAQILSPGTSLLRLRAYDAENNVALSSATLKR